MKYLYKHDGNRNLQQRLISDIPFQALKYAILHD